MIKELFINLLCFKNYSEVTLIKKYASVFFPCGVRATAKHVTATVLTKWFKVTAFYFSLQIPVNKNKIRGI